MTAAPAVDDWDPDVVLADIAMSRSITLQLLVVGSIGRHRNADETAP